jgi:hypothetical protein
MSGRQTSYLGAAEVRNLIGAWQSIVGSGASDRFLDLLGADVSYNPYPGGYRQPPPPPRHHHHYGYGGGGYGYGGPPPMPAPYEQPYAPPPPSYPQFPAGRPSAAVVRVHGTPVALGAEQAATLDAAQNGDAGAQAAIANAAQNGDPVASAALATIPPRNMLVDRPGPTRADRVLLPMSSGVSILPNTSAQITSRPQNVAFRPERVIIGGAPGDWIVNDIKVGNRSQFSQSGDVPGETFAATTIDSFVSFETVQTAMDFVMLVTYIGASESGAPFYCSVLGTAAI